MIKTKEEEKKVKKCCDVSWNKLKETYLKRYVLHRRQGQFIGFHFVIARFKKAIDVTFLISTGTSSQILGVREDNVSEPNVTNFIGVEWKFLLFFFVIRSILIEWKDFFDCLWWNSIHYLIQLSCKNLNITMVHWN